MFCMNCGKKIDDDSTFCPYCGGKVGNKTVMNTPISSDSGVANSPNKMISKKMVIGLSSCLIVIIVIVTIIKLFSGSFGKTLAEQLFLMSWEEMVDLDMKEFKSNLRDEGITYEQEDSDYSLSLVTKSVSSFMDYDCIFGYVDSTYIEGYGIPSFDLPASLFIITFNTQDDYKDGKADLLKYLNKNQSKECDVITQEKDDDVDRYMYLLDVSKDNLEKYVDCYEETANEFFDTYNSNDDYFGIDDIEESSRNLENRIEKIRDNISDYKVYKFCVIAFTDLDTIEDNVSEVIDLSANDYYDYGCLIGNIYLFMTDEEFYKYMAQFNYDAVSKKDIDLDEVRKTIDVDLLDEKIQDSESDLRSIYFVENHGMDIKSGMNVSNDELKRIWYIKTFGWDNKAADFVDLSDYKGSSGVYCAVTFNYNTDDDTYFESDLDKVVYLSEKNYNPSTGESFVSEDEKRLYFLENYNYDTASKKAVDREIVDALIAYQKYLDENDLINDGFIIKLLYIDEDDIPELFAQGSYEAAGNILLAYQDNTVHESYISRLYGFSYVEKKNFCSNSNGHMGYYYDIFASLVDGELVTLAEGSFEDEYDPDIGYIVDEEGNTILHYAWNNIDCSEEEYYKAIEDFIMSRVGDVAWKYGSIAYDEECYINVLSAYDALRTTTYVAFSPEILEFDLSDGILTVSIDDGSRYGWNDGGSNQEFSISYPVSDNCVWEERDVMMYDSERGADASFEEFKDYIDYEQEQYDECIKEYGFVDPSSPFEVHIDVVDDTVIRVYSMAH